MGAPKGGKGKGKGKGKGSFGPLPPPDWVEEAGVVTHTCEGDLVVKCTHVKVPYFNGRIFLEDKQEIGKIDEIFGPINGYSFNVKMKEGMKAESFKVDSKVFLDPNQTLPLDRFLPQKPVKGKGGKGKGKGKGKGGKGKGGKGKGGKGKGVAKGGKGKGKSKGW